jgi:predicted secreted protein
MASLTGNAGVVSIDGTNIAEVRSYSIEITSDTIESTTMAGSNSGRTYFKGLSSFSGSVDVYWDASHFSTADLDGLINGDVGAATSEVNLIVYPEGTGSNWNGTIIPTGYSISASFDGMIEASISFQGDGQLTYTAV